MRRPVLALSFAVATVVAGLLPFWPARADTVAAINPGPNQVIDKTYGPIVGQDPQNASSNVAGDSHATPTPDNCAVLPSCNVIPLTFSTPKGFTNRDTYVAGISLYFKTQQVGTALASAGTEDLDLFLYAEAYNEPYCVKARGDSNSKPPPECTTDLAYSANGPAIVPEVVRADVAYRQKYLLEVSNSGGVAPDGYRIHIETTYTPYSPPSESVGPAFGGPADTTPSGPAFSLPSLSPAAPSVSSSPSTGEANEVALSPVGDTSGLDSDLGSINSTTLTNLLQGPLLKSAEVKLPPARAPSSLALVVWMILVPVAVAGAATAVFVRRRPRALRL